MKKRQIHKFLYVISALLVIGFAVGLGMDWHYYNTALTSAPFWLYLAVRAVEFLLPAVIVLAVAWILKKKGK